MTMGDCERGSQVRLVVRRRRARTGVDRGSAALEFALVLIPFCVLLFGVIQYSGYFFSLQSGASAAREAARRAAVGDCTSLTTNAQSSVQFVQPSTSVGVGRQYSNTDGTVMTGPSVGSNVRITLTYSTVNFHFPFVPGLPHGGVITQPAVARVEQVTTGTGACS